MLMTNGTTDQHAGDNIIYHAMTAFTDQYSLPNIFLILVSYKQNIFLYWSVINRAYKCKMGHIGDIVFKYIHKIISDTFIIVQ